MNGSRRTPHCSLCFDSSADAKKFPVIAGGARFQCETDGAIYAWVRKERGFRRKHRTPLCGIEV